MRRQLLILAVGTLLLSLSCSEKSNTVTPEPEPREWSFLGLSGTNIETIAVNPTNQNIIYAMSDRYGLFRTVDGGLVWDTNSTQSGLADLDFHPDDPSILYLTLYRDFPGFLRSDNSGDTWQELDTNRVITPYDSRTGLEIDDKQPTSMYYGTAGNFGGGLFYSLDGGVTWGQIESSPTLYEGVMAVIIDPDVSSRLTVATMARANILRSEDAGLSWRILSPPPVHSLIQTLRLDPVEPEVFYLGTGREGVFRSKDDGESWMHCSDGLDDTIKVSALAVAGEYQLFTVAGNQLYTSSTDSVHWSLIDLGIRLSCLAVDSDMNLYAGGDGVYAWR